MKIIYNENCGVKNYMKIIAVIDKELTPNSLGTNDGQISRWGGFLSFQRFVEVLHLK